MTCSRRAVVLVAMAVLAGGCRRRGGDTRGHVPAPTGGAAAVGDAGDALIEDARAYEVRTWRMPLERYDVTIEDVEMTTSIAAVRRRTSGDLVINGGFFDELGKPLGLAVSGGTELSPLARRLSGGVVTVGPGPHARLFASETFERREGTSFALQCRPRLVVSGKPNVKSDDGKRSERTALCLRDGGRTIDVVLVRGDEGGPSLFALGRWLVARGCEDALNLDGGPSSGAAWRDEAVGEDESLPPRGPIRHAVVFKKK